MDEVGRLLLAVVAVGVGVELIVGFGVELIVGLGVELIACFGVAPTLGAKEGGVL